MHAPRKVIDMNPEKLAQVVTDGFDRATQVHDALGVDGAKEVRRNPVGDMSLECDIRCEEAVLNALRDAHVCGVAYTEEHGVVTLGDGHGLTIVIDGLDGSRRYKAAPGRERYATMVAVLNGDDPTYDDYLFCATKEHATRRLFSCGQGQSTTLKGPAGSRPLQVAAAAALKDVTLAYIDRHFAVNEAFFGSALAELSFACLSASSVHYEDLVMGTAQLVLECTRKRNLELASAYGLVRQAGGVMVTPDGQSLGRQRYRSFAQLSDKGDVHIPIVTACRQELAAETLERIRHRLPSGQWTSLTSQFGQSR